MFGKIGGLLDKAGDMLEKAVDAGKQLMEMGVPGADELRQLSETVEGAAAPVEALKNSVAGGVQADAAEAAKKQFDELSKAFTDAMEGDAKKLLPPGAACLASCWLSSVKSKLGAFAKETTDLTNMIVAVPQEATKELQTIGEACDKALEAIKQAAVVPKDGIDKIKAVLSKPDQIDDTIGVIEKDFNTAVGTAKSALDEITTAITGLVGKLVSTVEGVVNDVNNYFAKAPKKIASAFKPPVPICCCTCCGAAEALDTLQQCLDKVAEAVSLEPVLESTKKIKTSLEEVDVTPVSRVLEESGAQLGDALSKAKKAAGAAESGLRDAAGAEDEPPKADD